MSKEIIFEEKAREGILKGINKLSRAVKMTLGPRGRAVISEKEYGAPMVTFDGVTVAKEIELTDKFEKLGADFIKQAAEKTNDMVGDGTTTAIVLASAMINEGEKMIREKGFNVIRLSEELKKGGDKIIKELEAQRELIVGKQKIKEVATLSSKDSGIGELITEVMTTVGKDGVVTIEDSNTIGNSFEVVDGVKFDRGYISPYFMNNQERMECVLENPYILITDKKISAFAEILPILEQLIKSNRKELVIIADDVDGEALANLIVNKMRGVFNVLAVRAPGFGDKKKEMLQDLAVLTGAKVFSNDLGDKLEEITFADLGEAHKIIANKDSTTIVDGVGAEEDVEERLKQIKTMLDKAESDYDKERLKERLARLTGGIAVVKVGAPTESAQKELKQRVEDAVNATRAAMEEGIVPGGGIALFNIYSKYKSNVSDSVLEAIDLILKAALKAPLEAIIENSGENSIILDLKDKKDEWFGFNAMTNKLENLKDAGIIDPLKVVKTAFVNALSIASTYLTVGVAITIIPEKKEDNKGLPIA